VAQMEEQDDEIENDNEWFLMHYILPLTIRLGSKMLTQIRESKELDMEMLACEPAQQFLVTNRQQIQLIHRYYTAQEPKEIKMLTFRGLAQFANDFGIVSASLTLPALRQLYEAVNWISGHAHTEMISFEKFQQILTALAVHTEANGVTKSVSDAANKRSDDLLMMVLSFFRHLESSPGMHRVVSSGGATTFQSSVGATGATFFVFPSDVAQVAVQESALDAGSRIASRQEIAMDTGSRHASRHEITMDVGSRHASQEIASDMTSRIASRKEL
jgi:hypothetical protein